MNPVINQCFFLTSLFALCLSGCGPTYPKETLTSSLVALCQKEYGVEVSVQIVGKTLAVYVPLEKLFDSTLRLSPEVGEKLDGVILATSRVVLSTDNPPDFYVVVARDKRIPGVELKLIRYIQDIRRLNYGDLSRSEYTKRMLFEFGLGLGIFQGEEHFHIEEVRLGQFLADQIAQRIKTRIEEDPETKKEVRVKAARGKFIPGDSLGPSEEASWGRFTFVIDAEMEGLDLWETLQHEKEHEKKILVASLEVILEVVRGYRFASFDGVEIKTPFLKHSFVLSREVLELYRHKKIDLSTLLLPNDFNLSPHDAELLLKK